MVPDNDAHCGMLARRFPAWSARTRTTDGTMTTAQIATPRSRLLAGLGRYGPWLVILLPLFVYLAYLPRFGALQNNDYFGSITAMLGDHRSLAKRAERFAFGRSNEHRIAVPMLVYYANYRLSAGSNRPLSAFALAMMAVVFATLYRCLPAAAKRGPPLRLLFGLILACFVFTPVAAHNVAMGFSGTMWFLANVAFVLTLAVIVRRGRQAGVLGLWPVALFGLIGLFSYSTSLSMWPALLVAGVAVRLSWRQLAALAVVAAASYGYYFSTYVSPRNHPGLNTSDQRAVLDFFGIYLGGIFSTDLVVAKWLGWIGAALALVLVAFVLARRRDRLPMLAPWLAIIAYGVLNAVGTSIGRSSFGDRMGVASRYATLPGFFWSGLLIAIGCLLLQSPPEASAARMRRRLAWIALGLVAIGLAVPMYARGLPLLEAFERRARHQRLAELALVRGHYDVDALRATTPVVDQAWKARQIFQRLGHHPFHRPWPAPPTTLAPIAAAPPAGLLGGIDSRTRIADGAIRPAGWAAMAEGAPRIVEWAVADAGGQPVGTLVGGLPTPGSGRRQTAEPFAGWAGYATGIAPGRLRVLVRLAGDPTWYPLRPRPGAPPP